MSIHQFSFPTAIHFGAGARERVPEHLRAAGIKRPLIVTDKGMAALPITKEFESAIRDGGLDVAVFAGVIGNPTASQVGAGAEAYRAHRADAVIGFGGGAALDVAKAVSLLATNAGAILDYAWDNPHKREITRPLPWFIALPTTSGTGSEVGRSAVISDDSSHVKKIVFSPALLARAVFADPELTLDLPPAITAATGIDALTHNIESYLAPLYHPMCDGIAIEGVRLAAHALPVAVANGRDLNARTGMMMSSMMGAVAFQKDLGAVHSCAHALSAVLNLHHGLANALMLDHVMRFNLDSARDKLAELARVSKAGSSAEDFVTWLGKLKAQIGIPRRLADVGMKPEHVKPLIAVAVGDTCHRTNPRPCTDADFERLFQEAM
jgi:alcohol dehydrogenase class IV